MKNTFSNWIIQKFAAWLLKEHVEPSSFFASDFANLCSNIAIGDVLLLQGNNRISSIVRQITQSPWTHASLYIGRLKDIEDNELRTRVGAFFQGDENAQLMIESEIGSGTTIIPLAVYEKHHVRIARPTALTDDDVKKIVKFAIGRLGMAYDVRQLLDLARFLFPWGFFPRRWRSSLFQHNALQPTKDICSSMIADAFQSVDYPILPLIELNFDNHIEFIRRNTRLYTPSDFDYSPYFDVKKYPFYQLSTKGAYHNLPWLNGIVSDDLGATLTFLSPAINQFFTSKAFAVIGASTDRAKFGNKVLRCYMFAKKKVYPVNPNEKIIEGLPVIANIADLPATVQSISLITPPKITEQIVMQAIKQGIKNIWLQPGAESQAAVQYAKDHGVNIISGGACILQELGFHE